jgi:ABC-2 type transport system permease protein
MTGPAGGGVQPPLGGPVPHVVDPDRVPDAALVPPYSNAGLVDVMRRRYLLKLLVQKEIQARYNGSFLGLLWSYVLPLARFCMYFFVIGGILGLHKDVPNFAIHMFCGLAFVHYFTETFTSGTQSILRNKAIVRKMAMPREMFPVASMIVSGIHTVPQIAILLVASLVVGWSPTPTDLAAGLLGFAILTMFGIALALVFSAANVFFRDFVQVVAMLTLFTHWLVPMIYPWKRLADSGFPDWVKEVYLLNPLAQAVLLLQDCFWLPTFPDGVSTEGYMPDHLFTRALATLVVGIVFVWFAQRLFTRIEGRIVERL